MLSTAFDREFKRLQIAFEHPVKGDTAAMYYDTLARFAEPDLISAVNAILVEERTFPRISTLKDAIEKAAAARTRSRAEPHPEDDDRTCVDTCEKGLIFSGHVRQTDGSWSGGRLLGRCVICQRGYPRALPLVDPKTGVRV
jgi:hypothetical protein